MDFTLKIITYIIPVSNGIEGNINCLVVGELFVNHN